MLMPGETFPYLPLEDKDKNKIRALCGERPINNPEYLHLFLRFSGQPLVDDIYWKQFFKDIGTRSVGALDISNVSQQEATRAFNRGLLFYAGVLHEVTGADNVPLQETVMGEVIADTPLDHATRSYQAAIHEVPSFCELLDEASVALEVKHNHVLHDMALVGAGTMHIVTIESFKLIADPDNIRDLDNKAQLIDPIDPRAMESTFPELSGLQRIADLLGDL